MLTSRRRFLAGGTAAALTAGGNPARAVMGRMTKFDLVTKGGEVLDPSQG